MHRTKCHHERSRHYRVNAITLQKRCLSCAVGYACWNMTTVELWVRLLIHVQLCSSGFPVEFRVTVFYPRFTRRAVSSAHGGYAFTSAPEGWESHPHENQVVQAGGNVPTSCLLIHQLRS